MNVCKLRLPHEWACAQQAGDFLCLDPDIKNWAESINNGLSDSKGKFVSLRAYKHPFRQVSGMHKALWDDAKQDRKGAARQKKRRVDQS